MHPVPCWIFLVCDKEELVVLVTELTQQVLQGTFCCTYTVSFLITVAMYILHRFMTKKEGSDQGQKLWNEFMVLCTIPITLDEIGRLVVNSVIAVFCFDSAEFILFWHFGMEDAIC
mmetsp:Transcript_15683/g.18085  ORF Transcript_15683/g.18085 Transcript_15683/m.18085 type:complete len:116 (+) Transcript_15683:2311-2658(+)